MAMGGPSRQELPPCVRKLGILLFVDGDGSDALECIPALIAPIADGRAVFVSGSRIRGPREPGSFSPQQIAAGYVGGYCCVFFMVLASPICRPFVRSAAMFAKSSAWPT